jgi:hypothetical protein
LLASGSFVLEENVFFCRRIGRISGKSCPLAFGYQALQRLQTGMSNLVNQ